MTTPSSDARPDVVLDVDALTPRFVAAMSRLDTAARHEVERQDLEPDLVELVRLRASQVNRCDYCIDLHERDAAVAGVSEARIRALPLWRVSGAFSERERAALGYTEVASRSLGADPDGAMTALREQFSEGEAAALLAVVVMINAWNTLAVSSRAWAP